MNSSLRHRIAFFFSRTLARNIRRRHYNLTTWGLLAGAALLATLILAANYQIGANPIVSDAQPGDVTAESLTDNTAGLGEGYPYDIYGNPLPSPTPEKGRSFFDWLLPSRESQPDTEVPNRLVGQDTEVACNGWRSWFGLCQSTATPSGVQTIPQSTNNQNLTFQSDQTSVDTLANQVARVRVVKTGWRWYWPEYGYTPVAGVVPIPMPIYDVAILDPIHNATTSPNYANLLDLTRYIPGLPNIQVGFRCEGQPFNRSLPLITVRSKLTNANGFAELTDAEVRALGCRSLEDITTSLEGYGVPNQQEGSFDYYFREQETRLLAVSKEQPFAGTVYIGYRPTVLGHVKDESGQVVARAKVCLFYRAPQGGDSCDKEGLSASSTTDATGRYLIYGSWGEYAQKGAKQAYVVAETASSRQQCSNFALSGDQANLINCTISRTVNTSNDSITPVVRPANPVYRPYLRGPSSRVPQPVADNNQANSPVGQERIAPRAPNPVTNSQSSSQSAQQRSPSFLDRLISCDVLRFRIRSYEQIRVDVQRRMRLETEARWIRYYQDTINQLTLKINQLRRTRCS